MPDSHDPKCPEGGSTPAERAPGSVEPEASSVSRRSFLRWSALAGAGATLAGSGSAPAVHARRVDFDDKAFSLRETSIADIQTAMEGGMLTSERLVERYLFRIERLDRNGPKVSSVLETNPDAAEIARQLDEERAAGSVRGPLHGVPVLLKDNIDTGDAMMTTAGSLALVGDPAPQDATVTEKLREAGAVILGKAGLSEWANFRGFDSSSGWSGRGGQVRNPYVLDRNPCGSSAGSGAAVSANLTTVALATETDGSIVCPASACGVVGIKPSVGLTSRAGVVPISATQDTIGPHARSVYDAAAVLGALTGVDPRDPATAASEGNSFTDYTQFVDESGLIGARIGVDARLAGGITTETGAVWAETVAAIEAAGATVVPVEIPSFDDFAVDSSEIVVLVWEFKRDLNAYLSTRTGVPVSNLADCIAFNLENADPELLFFGQEWMEFAEAELFSEAEYQQALITGPQLAGADGLDATLDGNDLDALIAPTNTPAWPIDLITGDCFQFGSSSFAAVSGYPLITQPMGFVYDLPVGITWMGRKWAEPTLIRLASGFEAVRPMRRRPTFKKTFEHRGAKARPRQAMTRERVEQMRRLLTGSSARFSGLPRPKYL